MEDFYHEKKHRKLSFRMNLTVQMLHEAMGHAENKISFCIVFQHKKIHLPQRFLLLRHYDWDSAIQLPITQMLHLIKSQAARHLHTPTTALKRTGPCCFRNRFSAALSVSAVAGTWALQPERSCCWTNGGPNEPLSFLLLVFFQQSCRSTSERNLVSSGEIMCIKLSRIKTLTWFPVINTISSLIKALYLISSKWKEEKHSKM